MITSEEMLLAGAGKYSTTVNSNPRTGYLIVPPKNGNTTGAIIYLSAVGNVSSGSYSPVGSAEYIQPNIVPASYISYGFQPFVLNANGVIANNPSYQIGNFVAVSNNQGNNYGLNIVYSSADETQNFWYKKAVVTVQSTTGSTGTTGDAYIYTECNLIWSFTTFGYANSSFSNVYTAYIGGNSSVNGYIGFGSTGSMVSGIQTLGTSTPYAAGLGAYPIFNYNYQYYGRGIETSSSETSYTSVTNQTNIPLNYWNVANSSGGLANNLVSKVPTAINLTSPAIIKNVSGLYANGGNNVANGQNSSNTSPMLAVLNGSNLFIITSKDTAGNNYGAYTKISSVNPSYNLRSIDYDCLNKLTLLVGDGATMLGATTPNSSYVAQTQPIALNNFTDVKFGIDVTYAVNSTANGWYIPIYSSTAMAVTAQGDIITNYIGSTGSFGSWVQRSSPTSSKIFQIDYSPTLKTWVGACSGGNTIYSKDSGATWNQSIVNSSNSTMDIISVACSLKSNTIMCVGADGNIYKSLDGAVTWYKSLDTSPFDMLSSTYANGCFTTVGSNGHIHSYVGNFYAEYEGNFGYTSSAASVSGYNYPFYYKVVGSEITGTTQSLNRITSTLTQNNTALTYVTVGNNGVILVSQDGFIWSQVSSGTSNNFYSVLGVGNNTPFYIAVGAGGMLATSNNGYIWTYQTSGTTNDIIDVTYNNAINAYMYCGASGTIGVSNDGVTWTSGKLSGVTERLNNIKAYTQWAGAWQAGNVGIQANSSVTGNVSWGQFFIASNTTVRYINPGSSTVNSTTAFTTIAGNYGSNVISIYITTPLWYTFTNYGVYQSIAVANSTSMVQNGTGSYTASLYSIQLNPNLYYTDPVI